MGLIDQKQLTDIDDGTNSRIIFFNEKLSKQEPKAVSKAGDELDPARLTSVDNLRTPGTGVKNWAWLNRELSGLVLWSYSSFQYAARHAGLRMREK